MLLSCVNCSYNPLLADGFGNGDGYCVAHRLVLHQPQALTCGRLLRKDLALPDAEREQGPHQAQFSSDTVTSWRKPGADARKLGVVDTDTTQLRRSDVGRIVTDYAAAGTIDDAPKMMFLGQLALQARNRLARFELAQHELGRTYVRNCVHRDGRDHWTSANYLVEWTKEILPLEPLVETSELNDAPLPGARKHELAQWEIVMLRLQFLADVAYLAPDHDPMAELRDLPERAARAAKEVALVPLMKWVTTRGWELVEAAFPTTRFHEIRDAKQGRAPHRSAGRASEPSPKLAPAPKGRGRADRRK